MSESTERLIELGSAIDNGPYLVAERDDLLAVLDEVERLRVECGAATKRWNKALDDWSAESGKQRIEIGRLSEDAARWEKEAKFQTARAEKAEAALDAARLVILEAHDELMGESWECPHCGHSEPTADMDVMLLVLKPAARALRECGIDVQEPSQARAMHILDDAEAERQRGEDGEG